jgi:aminomethyltransferase
MPHRATLVMTGPDRLTFLNRMVTQELKGFEPWMTRRSFWLNRKGRIDGDLRLIALPDRVLIDVDVHAAARTKAGLEGYIITEECAIADETERWHRMSVHGPAGAAIVARASEAVDGAAIAEIKAGQVSRVRIAGVEVVVDRQDMAGEIGLEMLVPVEGAVAVYEAISERWVIGTTHRLPAQSSGQPVAH